MARKTDSSDILERARAATDNATVGRVFGTPVEKDGVMIVPVAVVSGGGGGGSGSGTGIKTRAKQSGDDSFGTGETGNGSEPDGADGEGSGGGFGFTARPAGVYVLKDGKAFWQPAVDVNKIVLGGQIALVAALLVLSSALKRRSRRRR